MSQDDDSIRILGFRNQSELPAFYDLANVFILASEREPWGLSVNEAMACGTPVAALRKGAVGELIDEGITGRTYNTLEELTYGLPSVLTLNRQDVRTRAEQQFSIERMINHYLAIYSSGLKKHDTRSR